MTGRFCIFRLLYRSIALAFIGIVIGAGHSMRQEVVLDVEQRDPTVIALPTGGEGSDEPDAAQPDEDPTEPGVEEPQVLELGLEITLADARTLFEHGLATFIDARNPDEFLEGHIQGAFFMNTSSFEGGRSPEVLDIMDPTLPVVIYCVGGDCDASHNTAVYLQQLGFEKIHIMVDGYPAWVEAGFETDTGPDPFGGGEG